MKKLLFTLTLAAAGALLATGCEHNDDGIEVDPVIRDAFKTRYSHAKDASWSKRDGYYVVEFDDNGIDAEAWYDADGVWLLTETDVKWDGLPAAVREAFNASEWASWHIDDIDKLEYPDRADAYVIEVKKADAEYKLWYSADGVLAKAVAGDSSTGNGSQYRPGESQPSIKEFIAQKYPDARIIDIEKDDGNIEVDIIDGRTPREVVFSYDGEWKYTETELRRSAVPQIVLDALYASEWGTWELDDVSHFDTPNSEYYRFELENEKTDREKNLKIDPNGNILN